jgi:hypothetical protein
MSPRCNQALSWFFLVAGVCLLALAAYVYFAPPPDCAVEAGETDIVITDGTAGQKRDVVLWVDNHSGQTLRVLGLAGC